MLVLQLINARASLETQAAAQRRVERSQGALIPAPSSPSPFLSTFTPAAPSLITRLSLQLQAAQHGLLIPFDLKPEVPRTGTEEPRASQAKTTLQSRPSPPSSLPFPVQRPAGSPDSASCLQLQGRSPPGSSSYVKPHNKQQTFECFSRPKPREDISKYQVNANASEGRSET